MSTLTELRERLAQLLADTANITWEADWLDEAIRLALHDYSRVRPRQAITTLTLSVAGREQDISSLGDILHVRRVWLPYTATDPEFPPNGRSFEQWPDQQKLYFPMGPEPQAGQVARLFYNELHTIQGLDGATSSTILAGDESLLAWGAAGYAASSRALDLMEQVGVDRALAERIRQWGRERLDEYRQALRYLSEAGAVRGSAFVRLPPLDKWD